MAANKIQYSDIFDPKALQTAIDEAKRLDAELKTTAETLKDLVKTSSELAKVSKDSFSSFDNIRKTEKAINDTVKASEDLDAIEKKRIQLQKQLSELEDKRALSNEILAQKLNQQKKALREEAKAAIEVQDAYKQLVKQTNIAQSEYKRLAAEFGATSEEAEVAYKAFIKLDDQLREINDAAKDGRRDVGRYRIALDNMNDSIKKIGVGAGVVAVLAKVFEGFQNVMGNNSEAAATLEKGIGAVTVTFTVLLSRIMKGLPVIKSLFISSFNTVSNSVESAFIKIEKAYLNTTNLFGRNDKEIETLNKRLIELSNSGDGAGATFEDLAKIFEGAGDEIEGTIKKNNDLIDTTLRYRRQILALQKEINGQLSLQAKLQAAADNENNSLVDRIGFQEKLIEQTAKIDVLEFEIAKKRKELADENARIFKDSLDAQEAAAAATAEYINLEIQQEAERLAQKTELSTLEADLLEQRLDFLIDNFDNQKTINERILADETKTFEERQALVAENEKLANESFERQLQLFNERLTEQGKAQLDFEKLVNESDSRLIAEEALNAGLSERLTTRVLEVIRERRIVIQDTAEAQKDLNEAQKESINIEKETILNNEAINKLKEEGVDVEMVLSSLEEKRAQQNIDNLNAQILLYEKNTEERIALENELSEALLKQQEDRIKKEVENEEKKREKILEIQEAAATIIETTAQKAFEKRIKNIDELLEAEKGRESELRELATKGIQDAQNNLAENQKKQAELERQREQELRRQKNFELALAAAKAYSANVGAGEKNPLGKTITDIAVLEAFINSLSGFYEGTELVKNDLDPTKSGKDGYVIRVDGDERILNPAQNAMLPKGLSNWDLVRLATSTNESTNNEISPLISEMQRVRNAIESKPSYLGRDYDATERAVIDTFSEKGKLLHKHYSRSGLISKRK